MVYTTSERLSEPLREPDPRRASARLRIGSKTELVGSQGDHVRGQALVGALGAALTAYLSVRFLLRFFETNRLTPFAVYCFVVGVALTIGFALT